MADPERRCILTGERSSPEHLVRLALSPDGAVMPDVGARAPGRGAWVGVSRAELETAVASGRLKGALSRAFKAGGVEVPADLPARLGEALEKQAMDRLGLEARASHLLTGSEKIEVAARRGQVRMLLHAADAASDGRRRLDQAWRVGEEAEGTDRAGQVLPVGREALSRAMGRGNVVHIAVTDGKAATRLAALLSRWQSYIGCANGEGQDTPAMAQPVGMSTGPL